MSAAAMPAPLPYRWQPAGTRDVLVPKPGQLLAWRHAAWRVIEVLSIPETDWTRQDREAIRQHPPDSPPCPPPYLVVLRPIQVTSEDPQCCHGDVRLRRSAGMTHRFAAYPGEHYPICAVCREPLPCREQMARVVAAASAARTDRFCEPGVCPACAEPVTTRQRSITFDENLEVPGGPPVTYHLRLACAPRAMQYERRWAAADPAHRRTVLSCPGRLHNHLDGSDCTESSACPGSDVAHRSVSSCARDRLDGCLRCLDIVLCDDELSPGSAGGTSAQ